MVGNFRMDGLDGAALSRGKIDIRKNVHVRRSARISWIGAAAPLPLAAPQARPAEGVQRRPQKSALTFEQLRLCHRFFHDLLRGVAGERNLEAGPDVGLGRRCRRALEHRSSWTFDGSLLGSTLDHAFDWRAARQDLDHLLGGVHETGEGGGLVPEAAMQLWGELDGALENLSKRWRRGDQTIRSKQSPLGFFDGCMGPKAASRKKRRRTAPLTPNTISAASTPQPTSTCPNR